MKTYNVSAGVSNINPKIFTWAISVWNKSFRGNWNTDLYPVQSFMPFDKVELESLRYSFPNMCIKKPKIKYYNSHLFSIIIEWNFLPPELIRQLISYIIRGIYLIKYNFMNECVLEVFKSIPVNTTVRQHTIYNSFCRTCLLSLQLIYLNYSRIFREEF
jgi:hypothetical protein